MNLYLISQSANNTYDTYDCAVVAAPDEETARNINPALGTIIIWEKQINDKYTSWVQKREQVKVEYLGIAKENTEQDVICASYRAG